MQFESVCMYLGKYSTLSLLFIRWSFKRHWGVDLQIWNWKEYSTNFIAIKKFKFNHASIDSMTAPIDIIITFELICKLKSSYQILALTILLVSMPHFTTLIFLLKCSRYLVLELWLSRTARHSSTKKNHMLCTRACIT